MRIFNEDKTQELDPEKLDFSKGTLIEDILETHFDEVEEIKEEGHYETIKEYPNGGKDVEWVIDIKGQEYQPARDEKEDIKVFKLFTQQELKLLDIKQKISTNKIFLSQTDYIIAKMSEKSLLGINILEDLNLYRKTILEREAKRKEINELEEMIKNIKNQ